ncbi:MAG: hypothetical protein R3D83_05765 [Caenibius sp.]
MSDIRKRVGKKGTTYQVRYPSKSTKSGYAFKSFDTLKEARSFIETGKAHQSSNAGVDNSIATVPEAIDRWLDICLKEGRDGRDPVTDYTHKTYLRRSEIMKAFEWSKPLTELQTPDIVTFRSWLLRNYSRDLARKTLTSFHAVIKEMALRGHISSNFASGVAIRAESRYDAPVVIPTIKEVAALLAAADRLANAKNQQIAKSWQRYRPILYLAADSGMRPQEYLAIANSGLCDGGVSVERAIERGGRKLSVPKTPAGRRHIELSPDTLAMVDDYCRYVPDFHSGWLRSVPARSTCNVRDLEGVPSGRTSNETSEYLPAVQHRHVTGLQSESLWRSRHTNGRAKALAFK